MKWVVLIVCLWTSAITAQIKDDISVVQFSAKFVTDSEVTLGGFKGVYKQTLYLSENKKIFEKESIKYLPTIIVYQDGEEMLRIESGIDLKLPEGCLKDVQEYVQELLEERF
tara:strand:- start:1422 stop:1757 length:336 start_codon:yes stop_codon:yes gene_type:complete